MARTRETSIWMWERARRLLEETERLQRHFFALAESSSTVPCWEPPLDIFETPTEMWVVVALPGTDPDSVDVAVEGSGLSIRGERTLPPPFRRAVVHRMELPTGRFERSVVLPEGRWELRSREVSNGCLALCLVRVP